MRGMKLGFVAFPKEPEEYIRFAVEHGFEHMEIDLFNPIQWLERFHRMRLKDLRRQLEGAKITVSFHAAYVLNLADYLPETRAAAVRYIERLLGIATEIGAQWVTVHPGYGIGIPTLKWVRSLALDCFRWSLERLLKVAERLHVPIALENLNPVPEGSEIIFLLDSSKELEQILHEFPSPFLGVCLDVGHAAVADGFEKYWRVAGSRCLGLHIHDNDGRDDLHYAPGKGMINWEKVVGLLNGSGFTGPLSVEVYRDEDKVTGREFLASLLTVQGS